MLDPIHVVASRRTVLAACTRPVPPSVTPVLSDVLHSFLPLWATESSYQGAVLNLPAAELALKVLDPAATDPDVLVDPVAFVLQPDGGGPPQRIDRDDAHTLELVTLSVTTVVVQTKATPVAAVGDEIKLYVQDAGGTLVDAGAPPAIFVDPLTLVIHTRFVIPVGLNSTNPFGLVALLPGFLPLIRTVPNLTFP